MREQEREVINVESQQITNPTIGSLLITVLDMEEKHDVMDEVAKGDLQEQQNGKKVEKVGLDDDKKDEQAQEGKE